MQYETEIRVFYSVKIHFLALLMQLNSCFKSDQIIAHLPHKIDPVGFHPARLPIRIVSKQIYLVVIFLRHIFIVIIRQDWRSILLSLQSRVECTGNTWITISEQNLQRNLTFQSCCLGE